MRSRQKTKRESVHPPVIGIDIGGVIVDRVAEDSDTSFFGARPMDTPAVAGAIEALPQLIELFEGRVHIVSKAGPRVAGLSTEWLTEHGVFDDIALPRTHVHFVRERKEKAPICERLGITHFVDDRLDVLAHLTMVEHRYLFTGGLGRHQAPNQTPRWVRVVPTWPALSTAIKASLGR